MSMKLIKGFTLIESIIAIIIMGFAMVTLTSFLYPQIERSAASQYQTRAVTLGQSMLSQILARGFDENSDFDGGTLRCGEATMLACTATDSFGPDGASSPNDFNDVDDYVGCWKGANSSNCSSVAPEYDLTDILGGNISNQYKNFTVLVAVSYVDTDTYADVTAITSMKKVTLQIMAGRWGDFEFVGYKGNY
ncbi:prepilin-type N-terminal cleavage/methylation domain-containing protein [Vibrio sp. 10N.261.55.A7]|uniref:prepilin-type N-terminal cleavage/methylation domain-containing protein n=1 Tax=Vibrio sp. 10N.261.55.A7 TaxID=1880851 RepID=UPI000C848B66|nr:prepilin-type N-terminal cleavage/methylation domain-containing protein [Vibrio sp. 10N.261.55.A7]